MADGSVVINIDADDKAAQKRLNAINRSIQKLQNDISKTQNQKLGITKEFEQANAQSDELIEKLLKLQKALAESEAKTSYRANGRGGNSALEINVDEYNAEIEKQKQLKEQIAEQEKLIEASEKRAEKLQQEDEKITKSLNEQKAALEQQVNQAGELQKQTTQPQSDKVAENVAKAQKKSTNSLGKGLKTILLWGFGIRSLFSLVSKLKSYVKDAVNTFASSDPETKAALNSLKSSLATLKASWGAAFAPIISAVIPMLNTLVGWLSSAANAVASFFAILSGKSTFKKAVNNANALSDSMGSAAGSAAEAKKELMSIDELNVMSDSSGGGGGGGASTQYMEEDVGEASEFAKFMQKIVDLTKEWVKTLDFEPIKKAFANVKASIGDLFSVLGDSFLYIYEKILLPLGKWIIEKLAPALLDVLAPAIDVVTAVIERLKPLLEALWENVLKPIAQWIGDVLIDVLETTGSLLEKIADLVSGESSFSQFIDSLSGKETVLLAIASGIAAISLVMNAGAIVSAITKFIAIFPTFFGMVQGFLATLMANPVALIIGAIVAAIVLLLKYGDEVSAWLSQLRETIDSWIDHIRDTVGDFLDNLISEFSNTGSLIDQIFTVIISVFKVSWEYICGVVRTAVDIVLALFSTLATLIRAIATGDWSAALETIKSIWSNVWEGIKNTFTRIANSIIGLAENMINLLITGLNKLLGAVSSVVSFFGGTMNLKINYASLPRLAKGGIVDTATPFIAGEAGKEAVIPLERNTGWIRELAKELADLLMQGFSMPTMPAVATGNIVPPNAMSGYGDIIDKLEGLIGKLETGNVGQPIEVTSKVYLDKRQIGEAVTSYQNDRTRARGT